ELAGVRESLRSDSGRPGAQHDEVPAEDELLATVVAGLALFAARHRVAGPEQVAHAFGDLSGLGALFVPDVGGIQPAHLRADEEAGLPEFLAAFGAHVELFPKACPHRVVPIVGVAHVDGASGWQPYVALLRGAIGPKLVGG